MTERLVADRQRRSKRKKRAGPMGWFCNPQVLKATFALGRLAFALVRLAHELVRAFLLR